MKGLVRDSMFCCGLAEIGGFEHYMNRRISFTALKRDERALICVTRRTDIKERASLRLRGFKKLGTWKNPSSGNRLTLWGWFPKEK